MISTNSNYHWVKKITAHTNGGGALSLTFHGDSHEGLEQFNQAEVTLFTDDVELVDRLIAAINGAANAPKVVAPEEMEAA